MEPGRTMNPEFRSPSGLPQSARSGPGPARRGRGRWAPERSPLDSDRRASAFPSVVRLTARTSHVISESNETNLRPSAVDRLDHRGAADPPGRRGRHRRSGSIAVDAARVPEDAPCPAGPCRRREARSGDSPGTTWALRTTGKRAHRCLSSGSSGRSWPSWWCPWSALGCPPTPIVPLASPAIPGEAQWSRAGRLVGGTPAVYEATLRPDADHTS
jgi:hypothetical protein